MRISSFRVGYWWKKSNLLFWKRRCSNKQIYWKYQVWFSRRFSIPTRQLNRKFFDWALLYTWEFFDLDHTRKKWSVWVPRYLSLVTAMIQKYLTTLEKKPIKVKDFRGRSCRKTLSAWLQRTLLLKLCKLRRKMEIFVGLSIRFPIWGARYESVNFLVSHNQTVFFQSKHRSRKSKLLFRRTMKWNIEKSLLRTFLPMPANQDALFGVEKKCFDVYNWKLYLN